MTLRQLIEVMRRASKVSETESDDVTIIEYVNEEVSRLLAEFPIPRRVDVTVAGYSTDISSLEISVSDVTVDNVPAIKVTSQRMEEAIGNEL